MKVVGIALLVLIALFTGGCSLLSLAAFGGQSFILSGPGLLIALVCIVWIKSLTRDHQPLPSKPSASIDEDDRLR